MAICANYARIASDVCGGVLPRAQCDIDELSKL